MNPYGQKKIAGKVWDLVEEPVISMGYSIWNVEYVKEGADMFLRITIDSENGIDIDDCEKVSRVANEILDEKDPIAEQYYLEVSSPGVERDLSLDFHFDYAKGEEVELKLYNAVNNSKSIKGTLVEKNSDSVLIKTADETVEIPCKNVAKAKTVFDWNSDNQ